MNDNNNSRIEYKTVIKSSKPTVADLDATLGKFGVTQPVEGGTKADSTKFQHDLIPFEALDEIAKVLTFGAKKYARANWANGIKISRLLSAAYRHLGQFNSGEDKDSESDTLHIANAATNLIFAIWMMKNKPEMDDRWAKDVEKI